MIDIKLTKKKLSGLKLLALDNKIWTVTFEQLLFLQPPISKKSTIVKASIYRQGQDAMKKIIDATDYLGSTPLEIAYRWSLPVQSFKYNDSICFNEKDFAIAFKDTRIGRIFDDDKAIQINDTLIKKKVKPNIFYYVEEVEGRTTNPLFDFFFLCKNNETKEKTLVLIDVTGGSIVVAENKLSELSKWIGEQKLEKFALKGFVLAPGAKMPNKTDSNATIIGQVEALELLGGLKQIFHWLIDDEENVLQKE